MKESSLNRREFIQQSGLAGGLMFAAPLQAFSQPGTPKSLNVNIKSRGYAGRNETDQLTPWEFERRSVGDHDVLIQIKYSGICHSDIHTIQGHWGKQQYPQVPGHEIAGIVTAVGKNVTKFKVGDKAGVGCMVNSCEECRPIISTFIKCTTLTGTPPGKKSGRLWRCWCNRARFPIWGAVTLPGGR